MSTKAQLQAVIDGYREELIMARQEIENRREAVLGLDGEADRQAERILHLEEQLSNTQNVAVSATPQPRLSEMAEQALLAVALMVENRAEAMACRTGSDIGEYITLCEEAHTLRSEVGPVDPQQEEAAVALYEHLTEPF